MGSTSFGQELLPTLLTQHQQQQERPTLPNAQDRFLLPVHRVWWSGLLVRAPSTTHNLTLTVNNQARRVLVTSLCLMASKEAKRKCNLKSVFSCARINTDQPPYT